METLLDQPGPLPAWVVPYQNLEHAPIDVDHLLEPFSPRPTAPPAGFLRLSPGFRSQFVTVTRMAPRQPTPEVVPQPTTQWRLFPTEAELAVATPERMMGVTQPVRSVRESSRKRAGDGRFIPGSQAVQPPLKKNKKRVYRRLRM